MNGRFHRMIGGCAGLVIGATGFVGCEPPPKPSATPKSDEPKIASQVLSTSAPKPQGNGSAPVEVIQSLRRFHGARNYSALGELVTPSRRGAVLALIRGLDAVFDADSRLHEAATRRFGGPHAVAWNLSVLRNNLGAFSNDVTILNQSFSGDRAWVTLQEGDHVPLVRVPLAVVNGRWMLDPDLPPQAMIRELGELTRTLDDIRNRIEKGSDFAEYLDSFYSQVIPQMKQVATAQDEANAPIAPVADAGEIRPAD